VATDTARTTYTSFRPSLDALKAKASGIVELLQKKKKKKKKKKKNRL